MNTPSNIKVLALDVDGVLTNGTIAFSDDVETKMFHVHDGLGISLWQKSGFHTVLISGRNAPCVFKRANELQIPHVKQGSKDKITDLNTFLNLLDCSPEEVCFVGDDLGDIAIMQHVGYSIAVQNAADEVKQNAHWTTSKNGGEGAVREAIEHLMKASNTWEQSVSSMMSEHATQ
jgi:3-deoxy-D-manno-octulosonate 8-phosphate phosphatase (KDO 8-P phosphatase)